MKTNKKQSIRILAVTAILFFSASIFAKANTTIKGRVLDNFNHPVEYATATIISPETMTIVEGDMCDYNGDFVIENVQPGEYILSVRQVGFDKDETRKIVVSENNEVFEVNTVVLNETNILLDELEVIAKLQNSENQKHS